MADGERVVVSLTTLPSRIRDLGPTLESILAQRRPPERVYVNLPARARSGREYPEISDLWWASDPRVTVNRDVPEDHGSVMKLYPTLLRENDPDTNVVTLDDDVTLAPDTLGALLEAAAANPGAVVGGSGWSFGAHFAVLYVRSPRRPRRVSLLEGHHVILYPRGAFAQAPHDLVDYRGAPLPAARRMDDVWIAGHLAARGVPLLAVRLPAVTGRRAVSKRDAISQAHGLPDPWFLVHFMATILHVRRRQPGAFREAARDGSEVIATRVLAGAAAVGIAVGAWRGVGVWRWVLAVLVVLLGVGVAHEAAMRGGAAAREALGPIKDGRLYVHNRPARLDARQLDVGARPGSGRAVADSRLGGDHETRPPRRLLGEPREPLAAHSRLGRPRIGASTGGRRGLFAALRRQRGGTRTW